MLAQSDRFSIFRYFLFSFFSFLLNFTNIIKHGFKMRTNVEGSKKNLRVGRAWTCARATTTTVEKKGSEKEVCIFKNTSDVKMYWFGKYFGHKTRHRVGESRWQRLCDCLWNGSHMVRVLPKKNNPVPHFSVPFCRFLLHLFPQERDRELEFCCCCCCYCLAAVAMLVIR